MRRTFPWPCLPALVVAAAAAGCSGSDAGTTAAQDAPKPPEKITRGMDEHKKLMLSQQGRRPGGPPARRAGP